MDLHAVGFTDTEISERLEVRYSIISQYRRKLGLKPNKTGPLFTDEQFLELYEGGFSDVEIGVFLCVPIVTVSRRRRKLGFYEPVMRYFTEEEFTALYEQGLDDQEIADKLEVFLKTIKKQRHLLGLTVDGRRALIRKKVDTQIIQGIGTEEIAEEFKRSKSYVNKRREQIMPWSRKVRAFSRLILDDAQLRVYYNQGLVDKEIAIIVGLTRSAIGQRRRNLGLPRHPKKRNQTKKRIPRDRELTPIELLKLIDLYERGYRNPHIAKELKVFQLVIRKSRVSLGLRPSAKLQFFVSPSKKRELRRMIGPHRLAGSRIMYGFNEYRASLLSGAPEQLLYTS